MVLKALLVGTDGLDEFHPVVEVVHQQVAAESVRTATGCAALRLIVGREGWFPDVIVALQAWPDQFSEADVHELIALCPLARIICCFGPWCDSDGRTRSIWPRAVRVPLAAAAGRLQREFDLLKNNQAGRVSPLPLTASRADMFEFDFGPPLTTGIQFQGVAEVISPDRPWKEMMESALQRAGFRIRTPQNGERLDVVVFDADPWDAGRAATLRAIRAADRESQIVAAVGFPQCELEAELLERGASGVWFKLAPLHLLFAGTHRSTQSLAGDLNQPA
jgi:hypothetical protein